MRPAVHQLIFYVLDSDRTRQYSISLHALQSYPCHELDWTIKKYISPERVKRIDEMPQCADGDRCICPNAPLQGRDFEGRKNKISLDSGLVANDEYFWQEAAKKFHEFDQSISEAGT